MLIFHCNTLFYDLFPMFWRFSLLLVSIYLSFSVSYIPVSHIYIYIYIPTRVPSNTKQTSTNRDKEDAILKPHRSVKGTEFCSRSNASNFKLQRTSTNAVRYKSGPSEKFVKVIKTLVFF